MSLPIQTETRTYISTSSSLDILVVNHYPKISPDTTIKAISDRGFENPGSVASRD